MLVILITKTFNTRKVLIIVINLNALHKASMFVESTHFERIAYMEKFLGKLNAYHIVTDFKAKMHQIRFPLELRPKPRWRSSLGLQRCPDP